MRPCLNVKITGPSLRIIFLFLDGQHLATKYPSLQQICFHHCRFIAFDLHHFMGWNVSSCYSTRAAYCVHHECLTDIIVPDDAYIFVKNRPRFYELL